MAGRVPAWLGNMASTIWRGRWSTTAASGPISSRKFFTTEGAWTRSARSCRATNVYTLTFPKDGLPAQYATFFWSVIAVDGHRFRVLPNPINRFLINNQSKLQYGADGSLTLYFADQKPADAPDGNWLPTPKGQKYRLTFRFYRPTEGVANGTYYPAAADQALT